MRGFLVIGLLYLAVWKSVGRHDYKIHFFFVQVVTKPAFLHNFFVPSFSPLCVAAANDTSSFQPKWQKMTQTLVREFISLGGSLVSVFETSFIESEARFTLACFENNGHGHNALKILSKRFVSWQVGTQWQSTRLISKRLWVQILQSVGLFYLTCLYSPQCVPKQVLRRDVALTIFFIKFMLFPHKMDS